MHFDRFAKFIALFMLMLGLAAPAYAQNNKPIRSGTWYEDQASLVGGSSQTLTLAQSPTDKFLNITHVACLISVPNGPTIQPVIDVFLTVGSTSGANDLGRKQHFLNTTNQAFVKAVAYYTIITDAVFFKVGPGRYPSIRISTDTAQTPIALTSECTIVGNLTDD
ncbi:hypothetical protein JQ612_18580 [Bradyrhizobium manausense]|uniref:hypothetical protein n=1 Tax=Bradyrhizobium manausense TaxID=989370 RepID=UPI001BA5C716|nr:hypothetical protein [Bradyrhizobium manausense]MBR0835196.1 hypothetical protein [Bradyrhizobium manausense]